jgi:hypothetical protein
LNNDSPADKRRLIQVLESYGADPSRWPQDEREVLRRLLFLGDPAVEEALKTAQEMDSILARAPAPAVDAELSRDRFLARLREQGLPVTSHLDLAGRRSGRAGARALRRLPWPAFGALAASLAAGIYAGAGGMAHEFIPAVLEGEPAEEVLWSPAIISDAAELIEDDQ